MPDFHRFKPVLLNAQYGDHEFFGKTYKGIAPVTLPIRALMEDALGFEVNITLSHIRFGLKSTPLTNNIHSDGMGGEFGMVWCLQAPSVESGTAFWKHRATGLSVMPKMHKDDPAGSHHRLFDYFDAEVKDEANFKLTRIVRSVENQAVFFKSNMWHSRWPKELEIADDETPRVVATVFFNRRNGNTTTLHGEP